MIQLESGELEAQLRQLLQELPLAIEAEQVFSRCDRCNVEVEAIEKMQVKHRVPPYVFQTQETFHRCPSCGRMYWAATHWQRACRLLDRLRGEASHA